MSPRTTAWLALVAILLGGFVYFYEIRGELAREAALDDEKRVHPGVSADAIDSIELTTEDGLPARFERREGRWWVVEPVEDRGNPTTLDAIASALADLPRAGEVRESGALEEYGLGDAARVVRFEVEGETRGLRVGASTPVGGHSYVARLSDDDVAYVEQYRLNALNHTLSEFREKRLFGFDSGQVRTLRISWPSVDGTTQVAVALDDQDEWQMGAPIRDRADSNALRELLTDLSYLEARSFVDTRGEFEEAALGDAFITLHWTLDGDHMERRARIGGAYGEGRLIEAPSGQLYTIDTDRALDFERTVNAYRFKTLSEFEMAEARQLELEFADEGNGGLRVEARLEEAGWSGSEPKIDPVRASDVVRALATLRAEDIVADEMGPAELASLGLSPARARIRIGAGEASMSDTGPLAEILLGRLDEERGLFAQRAGAPRVYVLAPDLAADLPISRAAFEGEFEARSEADAIDEATDGEELPPGDLDADPLEGVEIP